MARPDFPLNIDRRRLLASAAEVTVTGILPGVNRADADAAAADVTEPANFAPPRLGDFSKSPAETSFAGRQSCLFCRLQKSYAG